MGLRATAGVLASAVVAAVPFVQGLFPGIIPFVFMAGASLSRARPFPEPDRSEVFD